MPTASGMLVSQATSLQVAAVYACVRIRARDLARCTPQVLSDDGRGNKSVVADHPLTALFRRPNRVQPWFNFAEQQHMALMLRANAYAAILRDWRGTPTELIPLNPDLVTPMEAPDGSLFYSVARAGLWLQAVLADEPVVIPAEDVLHLRDLTFNTLVGVSRIALARDAIGLAMVQEQQAARWAANGARPAGVLQSQKTLSAEAAARLRQQWDQLQSGLQNTARTAILEDGLEWKQMALNSVDLEFGAARLYQVKEVARFFEVPLHKLGENESLPRASIAELNADYVQNVVMSDATRWEQAFEAQFGIGDRLEVKLDEKALLRADLATMTNAARTGVLSGLITPNEGRAIIGYGPKDGADTLLAPVNLAPNGSAADGVAPDGAGRPPSGLNPGDMKGLAREIAGAVAKMLKFDPDQPRDAQGRWAGGGGDGAAADESPGDALAASRVALSHEVRLLATGAGVAAGAALAALVLPEAVAGSFLVTGALASADGIAFELFVRAGAEAAKHALNDMGVDTQAAEAALQRLREVTKNAPDARDAKLLARLVPVLVAAAGVARDAADAKLRQEQPQAPDALGAVLGAAHDAYVAKLERLAGGAAS